MPAAFALVGAAAPAVVARFVGSAALAVACLATSAGYATAQASGEAGGQASADTLSTLDGVYTVEQAEEGREVFEASCAQCHATGYFTASAFQRAWSGRAVYWLFKRIHTIMPEDNPGSLRPREVADILAYVLQLNGYPAGGMELPDEDDPLRGIVWEALPESGPDGPGR